APQQQREKDLVLIPFRAKIPIDKLQFLPAGDKWKATIDIYVSAFDEHGRNIVLRRFTTRPLWATPNRDPSGVLVCRYGLLTPKGSASSWSVTSSATSTTTKSRSAKCS